jgi:Ca2+-binding EF-hand superfamily protein
MFYLPTVDQGVSLFTGPMVFNENNVEGFYIVHRDPRHSYWRIIIMVSGIDGSQISQWTLGLFDQLDSQNKGYIDKSGLATALDKVSGSSADVEDIFTRLDANSDGKVTKDEMTTVLQELFAQARSRRVMDEGQPGGPDGMPPPPPPNGEDKGFTADELSSQLEQIGSADSKRSELISNILKNFDEADADGDGKVTAKEAMAFDKANKTSDSSSVDSKMPYWRPAARQVTLN